MKKRKPKAPIKKVMLWGSVIGLGVWGYTWATNVPKQFTVGKLKYIKKDDGKLFFELPIINDSILSPELKDFTGGILRINSKVLGDVTATPVQITKRTTTTLQIQVKYKLWSVVAEFWQILVHNNWANIQVQLTGTIVAKQFITFEYPLDLKL